MRLLRGNCVLSTVKSSLALSTYILLAVTSISFAGTKSAHGNGNWKTAATWSPSGVPTSSDTVWIDNNATVTVDTIGVCAKIKLGNSSGGNKGTGTLTFSAGTSVTCAAEVILGMPGAGGNDRAGTINMTSGGTLDCGALTNSYSGTFTAGSGTLKLHSSNTLPAAFTTFNNFEVSSGTTTLSAAAAFNGAITLSGGLFTISTHDISSKGDWHFTGGSLNSSSTVTLNGTSAQTQTGNGNFCNLVMNNAAGMQAERFGVSQNLTMTSGIISISGTLSTGTASGGSNASYVKGELTQNVAGSDTFYYPVGDNGYAPVKVVATSGGNMLTINAIYGDPPSIPGSNILKRYWAVGGSVITVDMVFQYPAADVRGTESSYQAARYMGPTWDVLPANTDAASHTSVVQGVDNFNYMTLGESGSLPIQLSSLSAVAAAGGNVALGWSTASESNILDFTVQRRDPSSSGFASVSPRIAAAGTTLEGGSYGFTDAGLNPGRYTYRIMQTDADGSVSYSAEVIVVVNGVLAAPDGSAPLEFRLTGNYPNPFNPSTSITFTVPAEGAATLTVFDQIGRKVASLLTGSPIGAGSHSVRFDASNLSSGRYFYRLDFNGGALRHSATGQMLLVK